jgi:hypothetical protein
LRHRILASISALALVGSATIIGANVVAPAPASAGTTFAANDVFVSVFNSTVEEHSPNGALVQSFTSGFGGENDGSAFDTKTGKFFVTDGFSNNTVSKFDNAGNFLGTFGSGYNSHPESILFDAAGNAYVGQADGLAQILKFSPSGTLLNSYSPARESRGTDWIDLESDGCTMQYTSEGTSVKQFNVCTNTQLPDFATGLTGANAYAHRMLPDGTVLVADTSALVRVNSSGTVLHTYTPAESFSLLFAMNLDPDGKTFWTADYFNGTVFRFNIATGAEVSHFTTSAGRASGISVLGEITQVPKITLSPASATNPVNTNHTLTATATDAGVPAVGKTVTFKVLSGPNAGKTGTGITNGSGVATFTYTSTTTGTDTIQASFVAKSGATVTSNTATKTWTSGGTGGGNIFEVTFTQCKFLHVGYNRFPDGTVVHWLVTSNGFGTVDSGQFTAIGGGKLGSKTYHFLNIPLTTPLHPEPVQSHAHFSWKIGSTTTHYTVTRDPGC